MLRCETAPAQARCDGKQALLPAEFAALMLELRRLLPLCGKRMTRTVVHGGVGGTAFAAGSAGNTGSLGNTASPGNTVVGSSPQPSTGTYDDEVIAP